MKNINYYIKRIIQISPWLSKQVYKYRNENRSNKPVLTPFGFYMQGNRAMIKGIFEPIETRLIQKLLIDADNFINIGANIGYYTCLALANKKAVFAFEPMPSNLSHLVANIYENGWERLVEIFPIALSSRVGVVEIYGGGTGASLIKGWASQPKNYVTLVTVNTANNMLGDRLSGSRCLILMDVEGVEFDVLMGASKLLSMHPAPVWVIEITINEHLPDGLKINPNLLPTFDIFYNNGYRVWVISENIREIERIEIENIVNTGIDTLYSHNFLFSKNNYLNQNNSIFG